MDEVVVTARRVEENVQSVPLAITAMSGETLQRSAVRNIYDLSSMSPNLNLQPGNTGAGSTQMALRGQVQPAIIVNVDSAVGLYYDNLLMPRAYGNQASLVDIQRVEILNGPQGTLYGRNTTGGAINFITRDPTSELGAQVNVGLQNYDGWSGGGIINAPLGEHAAVRLVAQLSKRDGYGHNLFTGRELQSEENRYYRAKFKYENGGFRATLSGDYFHVDSGGNIVRMTGINGVGTATPGGNAAREIALELGLGTSPAALLQAGNILASYINRGDFYTTNGEGESAAKAEGYSLLGDLHYTFSDYLAVRSLTGFRQIHSFYANDNEATPFDISRSNQPTQDKFFSQELQLLGTGSNHSWVAGGYFADETGRAWENAVSLRVINGNITNGVEGVAPSRSYSIFGQGNYQLTDRLTVTLGARWSKEIKELINRNHNSAGCTVAPAVRDDGVTCEAHFRRSDSAVTWLASLDYKLTDEIMVYVKASRGFRGGAQNLRGSGAVLVNYNSVAPEFLTEYEVGWKSDFLNKRLRINLAAFYDKYTDVQRTTNIIINQAPITFANIYTNAASAHLIGLEGQGTFRVTPSFTLNGTFGLLKPKYDEFVDARGDRSQEPWPAPRRTASASATYVHDTPSGPLTANLAYVWQSKSYSGTPSQRVNEVTMPAYGLLNGTLAFHLDSKNLDIELWARNLTDKKYYVSSIVFEAFGYNVRFAGQPRMYGVRLRKTFGSID